MNNDLIKKIDNVITNVEAKDEDPSQEIEDLLDVLSDVSENLKSVKQEKTKTVQTPFFAFPNMAELSEKLDKIVEAVAKNEQVSADNINQLKDSIERIKIDVPTPEVTINVPEVKVPTINVPKIEVPPANVILPDEMAIKKPSWIENLIDLTPILKGLKAIYDVVRAFKLPTDPQNPISVRLSNGEKFYNALGGVMSAISGAFPFKKADSSDQAALVRDDGTVVVEVTNLSDLTIDADQINLNTDQLEAKLDTLITQTAIGTPTHFSGTVGITPVDTVTPASTTKSILIENTHATQNVLISFNSGSNWKTIRPYGVLSIDCAVASFQVKGSGASTTYEGIYVL